MLMITIMMHYDYDDDWNNNDDYYNDDDDTYNDDDDIKTMIMIIRQC